MFSFFNHVANELLTGVRLQRVFDSGGIHLKTLKDLACLATQVHKSLEAIEGMNYQQIADLQDDISALEGLAPGFEAVTAARVKWYEHGLASFEHHFVELVESGADGVENWHQDFCGYPHSPPGLVMHWVTLSAFLRRDYLGNEAFSRIYPRLKALLERLVEVHRGSNEQLYRVWLERYERLEKWLLEGLF